MVSDSGPDTTNRPNQGAREVLPMPDPRVLQAVRSSAVRLIRFERAFIQQLQSDIRPLVPGLAGDGWAFCERLVHVLLWIATADQAPHAIADALRWVGERNRLEGFPEPRYQDVAHALVRAVRNVSGDNWTTSTGSAWISYFLWSEPYLLAGAQRAAAQQAAAQAQALRQDLHAGRPASSDVDLEAVADLLDEEDEDDSVSYGQIMVSMTRNIRRERA